MSSEFFLRALQSNNGGDGESTVPPSGADPGSGSDAYEFVAFLLWYLFLVLCCVVPTCCAYRRRRLNEARLAQQQATFDRMQRQNQFLQARLDLQGPQDEASLAQRTEIIVELIKPTTMVVKDKDLVNRKNVEGPVTGSTRVVKDMESGEIMQELEDINDNTALQLPQEAVHGARVVPGVCAICLTTYETDDEVTWSPEKDCQHAFHKECIVPWLAKKDEPRCPCCRQDFCHLPASETADREDNPPFFMGNTLLQPVILGHTIFPSRQLPEIALMTPSMSPAGQLVFPPLVSPARVNSGQTEEPAAGESRATPAESTSIPSGQQISVSATDAPPQSEAHASDAGATQATPSGPALSSDSNNTSDN